MSLKAVWPVTALVFCGTLIPSLAQAPPVIFTNRLLRTGVCEGVTVGDVFGDGQQELVAAFPTDGKVRIYDRNYVLIAEVAFNEPPRDVAIGDTDGDGQPELIVGTAGSISDTNKIDYEYLMGAGADDGGYVYVGSVSRGGTFEQKWKTPIWSIRFPNEIAVADLNGNGVAEIIVGRSWYDRVLTVFEYSTNGYQTIFQDDIGSDVDSVFVLGNQLLVGTACWSDYALRVYDSDYTDAFYTGGDGYTFVSGGDLQGDGQLEIVRSVGIRCDRFVPATLQVYTNQLGGSWALGGSFPLVNRDTSDFAMVTTGHLLTDRPGRQIVAGGDRWSASGTVTPARQFLKLLSYRNGVLTEVWSEQFTNPITCVFGLCCADLDSDGVDELYLGTTEGLYVCRAPVFPHRAAASAIVTNGFVVGVTITDPGYGYTSTNVPVVLILGGGGNGAGATAVVSNGVVVNIRVTDAGIGYTTTPTVYIYSPFGLQWGLSKAVRPAFSGLSLGANYQLYVSGDRVNWTNFGEVFMATNSSMTYPFWWDVADWNQLLFQLLPQGAPCVPYTAAAQATVVDGFVVGMTVTHVGCGYTNPPCVLIEGGGGTGAAATAVVSNGVVVNIQMTDAGIGYTNTPDVVICPPPAPPPGAQTGLLKGVIPSFSDLGLGQAYQLQMSEDLAAWANQGLPFTPSYPTMPYRQYFDVSQAKQLFFRLRSAT